MVGWEGAEGERADIVDVVLCVRVLVGSLR